MDLFAGSGSLGLESLSRGCKTVCFVDKSLDAIKLIKSNLLLVKEEEFHYKIFNKDALNFIKNFSGLCFDIVFLDPPFKIDTLYMESIFNILATSEIIDENSVIIYEFFFKRDVDKETEAMDIFKLSSFGEKKVAYLRKKQNENKSSVPRHL